MTATSSFVRGTRRSKDRFAIVTDAVRQTNIKFVEAHLGVTKHPVGDEYDVRCVFHQERNASMRVNVGKGAYFCHGCHAKGGMKALAKQLGVRYSYDQTEAALANVFTKLEKLKTDKGAEPYTVLDESALERYLMPTGYWTDARPAGRGFTDEMVELFDLGYDPINDIAIIPARDWRGRLLGFTRRYLEPNVRIRYKDPKGFDKAHHLFGAWLASEHESSTVVLTEGPLDAVKVWQAGYVGVAQYGSYLTAEHIKTLRRIGTVTVVLMFDNDKGGRTSSAYAKGFVEKDKRMVYEPEHDLRNFFVVKQVPWSRYGAKDAGDMADLEIDDCICNAKLLVGR